MSSAGPKLEERLKTSEQQKQEETLHREQQIAKLIQICEDIDTEDRGYITVELLAKILKGLPNARPELTNSPTVEWPGGVHAWLDLNGGSSIKGKVNYRHFFRNVNLFNNAKAHDHHD